MFKGVKEMRKSFRYGRDYMVMDLLKENFEINKINMIRIRSNKKLGLINKDKKTFVKNCKFIDEECIYCMMENFINIGDLGKNKEYLKREDVYIEPLKIRLFK